jgi:hypothetical protein
MTIDDLYQLIKNQGVKRDGNKLETSGYLDLGSLTTLPEGVTLSASHVLGNWSQVWRGKSLRSIDGIIMELVGQPHPAGNATVQKARYFGRSDDSESVYVAFAGDHTAHGATVREAIEDAVAKAGHASPEQVIVEIKTSGTITRSQYRALTGACREGVRQWCRSQGVADDVDSLPIADVLQRTSGHYGGERIKAALS